MEYSKATVKEIGYLQHKLLCWIGIAILANILCRTLISIPIVTFVVSLVCLVMYIVYLWKMLTLMGKGVAIRVISCVLLIVPLVNLIELVVYILQASAILKQNGVKVGLLGASSKELERLTAEE